MALYIAGVMLVSIVATAMTLHYAFGFLGITPESGRRVHEASQFAFDYTFYMNVAFVMVAVAMVVLHRKHIKVKGAGKHKMESGGAGKKVAAMLALFILAGGLVAFIFTGGTSR